MQGDKCDGYDWWTFREEGRKVIRAPITEREYDELMKQRDEKEK